ATAYKVVLKGDEVHLEPLGPVQWLKYPLPASTAYERALKRLCRKISEDPAWTAWWAQTPYKTLYVHITLDDFPWDFRVPEAEDNQGLLVSSRFSHQELSIFDQEKPDRKDVNRAVDRHLREILTRTAEHVKRDPPEWRCT
ncbi:MAG TPA: hypothetical protein VF635_13330, partial [Propionibacteriaceae bacterium]